MKKSNKKFFLFLHQLPQNILGFILVKLLKAETMYVNINGFFIPFYFVNQNIRVSLGDYIIVHKNDHSDKTLLHEYGHHLQSLKLGWLYLFVIGIPSFIGCCIYYLKQFDYFNLPWEKWADKLGGVVR